MNEAVQELVGILAVTRRERRIKKSTIAEACSCPVWVVTAVESSAVEPTLSWLLDYAAVLDMDITWMLSTVADGDPSAVQVVSPQAMANAQASAEWTLTQERAARCVQPASICGYVSDGRQIVKGA